MGGVILLFINFIVVNLLTLYYNIFKIDVHLKLKLFNISLVSIERTSNGFGYVLMGGGMLLSILIGGTITLIIYIIYQHKKKPSN